MKNQKHNIFTMIGLCMFACLLVVDRFVLELPNWVAILIALVGLALIFIGFRKSNESKRG